MLRVVSRGRRAFRCVRAQVLDFFFFCPLVSEKLGTKGKGRVTLRGISILHLTPPAGIQHSGTSVTLLIGNGATHIHGSHELIPFRSLAQRSHNFLNRAVFGLCCH